MPGCVQRGFSVVSACMALAAVLCCGCAVQRPTLTPEQLQVQFDRYLESARGDTAVGNEKMVGRMRMEHEAHLAAGGAGPAPTFDILILSGGGDYGAFGAGFLKGWGEVARDHPLARPEFDVVTGVSTGALIAPFAFVGDDPSYERIVDLYTRPKRDWVSLRDWLFFLPGRESFMSVDGLSRDVRSQMDADLIAKVAEGSRRSRVLAINTTNLDAGAMHPWELSKEAERAAETGDADRFHKILMASAAIPAIFPPVVIDESLYVDGGVTSNILYGANWRSERAPVFLHKQRFPREAPPKLRFWVVVNIQIGSTPQIVQPTWISITRASMGTAIKSSTLVQLRHLATQAALLNDADGVPTEFRFIAIPQEWTPPVEGEFRKETMESLAELGLKLGRDPASWRSDFR